MSSEDRDRPSLTDAWVIEFLRTGSPASSEPAEGAWARPRPRLRVRRHRPLWAVHATALLISVASLILVAANYSHLPDPYPRHWDDSGRVDRWVERSWGAVLAVPVWGCRSDACGGGHRPERTVARPGGVGSCGGGERSARCPREAWPRGAGLSR
ncbi:DUF1648 domain-containing protein [Propionibacterium cyclohexanicum]|uniref:DUF1648 domain-containing protein n=1 Tax=Propionibacterium cyclohexanicum TaxID=64702 RepID=UPI000B835426